jgi:hypothetical protein
VAILQISLPADRRQIFSRRLFSGMTYAIHHKADAHDRNHAL